MLTIPQPFGGLVIPRARGVAAVPVMAFRTSSISSGDTITLPSTIQAGDLLVLGDAVLTSGGSAVVPSGFTAAVNTSGRGEGVDFRAVLSWKLATGSEASSTLTGMAGKLETRKVLLVFSGGFSSLTPSTFNVQFSGGDPSPQNVAAGGQPVPLVVLGMYYANASVSPRTMSPAKDGEVNSGNLWLAYKIFNADPENVTVDMADVGGNILASGYIRGA